MVSQALQISLLFYIEPNTHITHGLGFIPLMQAITIQHSRMHNQFKRGLQEHNGPRSNPTVLKFNPILHAGLAKKNQKTSQDPA